jgi:hypothetical protein
MPKLEKFTDPVFEMDAHRVFSEIAQQPDPDAAFVFLDTNVLLAPYRASPAALGVIQETYSKLRKAGRLIVPAQVAREFAKNRMALLTQLHKSVRDSKTLSINGRLEDIPILQSATEYQEARQRLDEMYATLKSFRNALEGLTARVESWQATDPVTDAYRKIFDAEVVRCHSFDVETFEKIRSQRYAASIPPGYRDKGKEDGGGGDLAVWLTILEVASEAQRDVILVTEDSKDDWFHRTPEKRLFPRYELVEEFSSHTNGKAFGITSLSSLLERYGATKTIVDEVADGERDISGAIQLTGAALITWAEEAVRERLRAAAPLVQIIRDQSGSDLIVTYGGQQIGIDIVAGDSIPSERRSPSILRALRRQRLGKFDEVAVVFVVPKVLGSGLDGWLAEENSFGAGVSAILAEVAPSGIRVVANQSFHPLLREAFRRN